MSSEAPTPRQLRRLGAIVLLAIAGLGLLVSKIPELLRPEAVTWVVTIPVKDGADGLEAGGDVLVGGMLRGRILNVKDIADSEADTPERLRLIRVDFELDKDIVLARDAFITRGATTAGNIGFLDISFPGSPSRRFKPGEHRVIPITRKSRPGGPAAGLLGQANGEMLIRISEQAGHMAGEASKRKQDLTDQLASTWGIIQGLKLDADSDASRVLDMVARLGERLRVVLAKLPLLREAARRLQSEAELASVDLQDELERWRRRFARMEVGVGDVQEDVSAMQAFARNLEPRLETAALDLQNALEDADAAAIRLRTLSPEVSVGLARTMARMVLAGGQLKLATQDLLPLALEAITTRPDRASLSRRLLLESTNDVVLAGMDLRDAARRLERSSRSPGSDPGNVSDPRPGVMEALQRLEQTLERLGDRLQDEIEGELR